MNTTQKNTSHPRRHLSSWLWLLSALALLGSILACNFKGGSKPSDTETTADVQATTTEIARLAQGTLSVLATQTAEAIQTSPTLFAPSPFPTQTATSTMETPTATNTAVPPTATNTPITPTAVPPTATAIPIIPTATPVIYYNKISFRQGGTSAYLQKTITNWANHQYSVRAAGGQTMILSVSSPHNDVYLDVKGLQDGQQLLWAGAQARYWSGTLPKSQDYLITLWTYNPDTYYFLSVEIPANIYFDAGAYSDKVDGYIDVDDYFHPDVLTRVRYLAYAFAGQKMTVKLNSPNLNALSLGIVGQQDGKVYLQYEVKNSEGTIKLPSNQGYYIDVYSVTGKSTDFTLKVTIK